MVDLDFGSELFKMVEGNSDVDSEIGVILPTYSENANIKKLIREIENLGLNISILVIDDSSPDGTANTVRELQRKHDNILLFVRPKKSGLGTAITDGFKIFLSLKKPPNCIVTMDADFSHDPKDLVRLVSQLRGGCDLVIGCRYCYGGNTVNWSALRLAISRIANFIASLTIRAKVSDYTSGLRCYSITLVRSIIRDLHSETYEIQIETIRQANIRGFKMTEIPITFIGRKKGKSKLTLNEVMQFLSYIIKLMSSKRFK